MDDDTKIRVTAGGATGRPVEPLLWVDIETTGLDLRCAILEITVVATDQTLREEFSISEVVSLSENAPKLYKFEDAAMAMHARNGLLAEVFSGQGPLLGDLERRLSKAIIEGGFVGRTMAGNCPSFDRGFLAAQSPILASLWSHRHFDVRALLPFVNYEAPEADVAHRALPDVRASIRLARKALGWA